MSTSIPVRCDTCHHEHVLSEHLEKTPQYYVYRQDQTLSYLLVYCPSCKNWGRVFGRIGRAIALELRLSHTPGGAIDEPLERTRNSWMGRHGYTLEQLINEMLLATSDRVNVESVLAQFSQELDALSAEKLAFDAHLSSARKLEP